MQRRPDTIPVRSHDALFSPLACALLATLLVGVLMLFAPAFVDPAALTHFIAEDQPLEQGTVLVWMLAGVCLLWPGRRPRWPALSFAIFCFTMGVREQGLPASIVPHGRRLVQSDFYLNGPESLTYRLVAGAVVLLCVLAVLHVLIFLSQEAWKTLRHFTSRLDTALFVTGIAVLVAGQLAEAMAKYPGVVMQLFPEGWNAKLSLEAVEESWEAMGALIIFLGAFVSRRLGRTPA